MTRIFFDHQKFSTQRYGGISRYFSTIIDEIKTRSDFSYKLGIIYSENHYINREKQYFKNSLGRKIMNSKNGRTTYFVNEKYCNSILEKSDFDIFHPTYYDPYFFKKLRKPLIITVHDMTYERLPEYFWANDQLTYQKRINIERADQIIAISETTKADILKYNDIDPNKIKVIYHGIDLESSLKTKSIPNLPDNYILFVGDRSGYKNFYLLMNAFACLHQEFKDVKIILTGGGPMGIADVEFLKRLKVYDKVSHIQVSDEELNFLYENALLFVYPSLYEGFGLPILEAFKSGCPVLLSDTDCFREIGGNAVEFFDPYELEHLQFKIEELLKRDDFRASLVLRGYERLLDFDILTCTSATLDLYKSMI